MFFFWILWGLDALVALVALFFFLLGLSDGTVSADNILLWLAILAVPGGALGGSIWLKKRGHLALSLLLLGLLAVPALCFAIIMIVLMSGNVRWN